MGKWKKENNRVVIYIIKEWVIKYMIRKLKILIICELRDNKKKY